LLALRRAAFLHHRIIFAPALNYQFHLTIIGRYRRFLSILGVECQGHDPCSQLCKLKANMSRSLTSMTPPSATSRVECTGITGFNNTCAWGYEKFLSSITLLPLSPLFPDSHSSVRSLRHAVFLLLTLLHWTLNPTSCLISVASSLYCTSGNPACDCGRSHLQPSLRSRYRPDARISCYGLH
jgi:hypothetical protein